MFWYAFLSISVDSNQGHGMSAVKAEGLPIDIASKWGMWEHADDVCIISSVPVAERWKREIRWQEGLLSSQEERAIFQVVDMPQHSEEYIRHGNPRQSSLKPADSHGT